MSEPPVTCVGCPTDDCRGVIRVRGDLPGGVYSCICHARQLRLSWGSDHADGRHPILYVEDY